MAAGQGFKTFATGDVLTAPDVNGYLMQGVLVFASATARDAAITSPQQGQTAYLKDSNTIVCYSGSAWVTKSGGGSGVLQVVQTTYSTEISVTGQTMTDSGLSLSITPTLNTSKVLVIVNQTVYADNTSAAAGSRIQLLRGSTTIYGPEYGLITSIPSGFNFVAGTIPLTYLDSPATTSSTTYKTQFNGTAAAVNAKVQWNSFPSTITLLEIGA